jgi:hypothetical protein
VRQLRSVDGQPRDALPKLPPRPRDRSAWPQAYALKRLAKGLASGRGAARQGFALALAGALAALPAVPVRAVLDLLEAVLGAPASAKARMRLQT